MSFDIFLRSFSAGESSSVDASAVKSVLDAHVAATDDGWARIQTTDGGAELFGYDTLEDGFMITHTVGSAIWDLLVTVASIQPLAITPVGCPTCVTDRSMLVDLPPEIAGGALVISTGAELLQVIKQG